MAGQYVPSMCIFQNDSCVTSFCFATALESPISTYMVGLEASILKRQEVSSLREIIHTESHTTASNQKTLKSSTKTRKVEYDEMTKIFLGTRLHSPNQPRRHLEK